MRLKDCRRALTWHLKTARRSPWSTTQRVYGVAAFVAVLAIVAHLGLGLPFSLPLDEAWLAVALFVVIVGQNVWRVDGGSPFRTSSETMTRLTNTFALFLLSPTWLLLSCGVGAFVGIRSAPGNTTRQATLNASFHSLAFVLILSVTARIGASGPTDASRALLTVVSAWVIHSLATIFGQAAFQVAFRRGVTLKVLWLWSGKGSGRRLVSVIVGYLLAVAVVSSTWMTVGVSLATAWMYYVFYSIHRSAALEREIAWFATFGRGASRFETVADVEAALVDVFRSLNFLTTHAIASPDSAGGIRWEGLVAGQVESGFTRMEEIAAIGERSPVPNPHWLGHLWAWPIDERSGSYLVISGTATNAGVQQLTVSGSHLVSIARGAVDTIRYRDALRAEAEAARERARTDQTTGLPNALALSEYIEEVVGSSPQRSVTAITTSLVAFDHTVSVLGWSAGEARMKEFAGQLSAFAAAGPDSMMIGRLTDDALCIVSQAEPQQMLELAANLAESGASAPMQPMLRRDSASWPLWRDLCVGVTTWDGQGDQSPEELLRHAQLALSRSRVSGRLEVVGDDDLEREARQLLVRMRLPRAIEQGAIVPAVQPQVDLTTGEVVGGEVLARWDDPVLGKVPPLEFVTVAEQSQQIELLTLSLFEQVLASPFGRQCASRLPLAFNLSARSLGNRDFLRTLTRQAYRGEQPIADIRFEVSESSIAEDPKRANEGLALLRASGARVAIDDFGTGQSVLSRLDQLEVDEVKVSAALVARVGTVACPNPTVKNLLLLCNDLDLAVVASGIEEPAARDVLHTLGCVTGQGYLFAPPIPLEAFAGLSR